MKNLWKDEKGSVNYTIIVTLLLTFAITSVVYMVIHDTIDSIVPIYDTMGTQLGVVPDATFDSTFYVLGGMFEYSIIWAFVWIVVYSIYKVQQ